MKKLNLILIAVIMCLVSAQAQAATLFHGQPTSKWSGDKTASALIASGPCVFHGLVIKPDGTNAITVTIYDSTAASGTTVFLPAGSVIPGTGGLWAGGATPPSIMANGIYVGISVAGGGSVSYTVEYDQ